MYVTRSVWKSLWNGQIMELSRKIGKEKPSELHLKGCVLEVSAEKMSEAADRVWGRVRRCWELSQSWSTHLSLHYKSFWDLKQQQVFYHLSWFLWVKNLVRDWLSTSGVGLSCTCSKKPVEGNLQGWIRKGWLGTCSVSSCSLRASPCTLSTLCRCGFLSIHVAVWLLALHGSSSFQHECSSEWWKLPWKL